MVTLEDVAVKSNLNKGSVSRILNGKGDGYSSQTRQRVLDTAAEMGYQPNMLARALQTGQTNTVALWLQSPEYYSPYFGYLQHCIQLLGAQHRYQMITEVVPHLMTKDSQGSNLVNWPVDGILCCYMTPASVNHLLSLVKRNSPMVCLQQTISPELEHYSHIDYVFADMYSGAKQAVEHLLEAGCRRIALITMPHMLQRDPRAQACRDLLGEAGQEPEFILTPKDAEAQGSRQCGYDTMKAYIERHGCPDGLFCTNDELAIGAYLAMEELGIQVPHDVLLIGFDGLENARLCSVPISSVTIPIEEMCASAWTLLLERIKNPDLPTRQKTFTTGLQIRASSDSRIVSKNSTVSNGTSQVFSLALE